MSEESKQGAPGGASSATACEDCWRPKDGPGGCSAHERNADHYGWTEDCQRATIARLRASLSTAEDELLHCREALREVRASVASAERTRLMAITSLNARTEALSTAEKALGNRDLAIRWALGEKLSRDGRPFDPAEFGWREGIPVPRFWWRTFLRLFSEVDLGRSPATDAAQAAPKTPDSSALEKALGALRAVRKFSIANRDDLPAGLEDCFECGFVDTRVGEKHRFDECAARIIDEALSGGAHVDALKAQKEEEK